jgi:hypothetical protein
MTDTYTGRRGVLLISIAGKPYTKATAWQRCQRIFGAYLPGEDIANADDRAFVLDLIRRHPDAEEKIGAGVDRLLIRRNIPFRNVGVWIKRRDGTLTDVSMRRCLDGRPSAAANARKAMRWAILDQVIAARDRAFAAGAVRCPFTGELLTVDTCHIDHAQPDTFEVLSAEFAELEGGWEAIVTSASLDGMIARRMADSAQIGRWRMFHVVRARLQVVSLEANLSILRKRDEL